MRTALLSVSDKSGLVPLVEALAAHGVTLISTGGTCRQISAAGFAVTDLAAYTGFPEIMAGRVKTLHPRVHGGLLGRRGLDDDLMQAHGIEPIDLVVVNLYPFAATVSADPSDLGKAIENIDIGGPAMIRSAAKNYHAVAVLVDRADYGPVLDELSAAGGSLSAATRFRLAVKAFEYVARYDAAISNYLSAMDPASGTLAEYPGTLTVQYGKRQAMRYGENPHQSAAFYTEQAELPGSVASALQHQGKALSYNNVADTDAALQCVRAFDEPACVIVKHANPCGVAIDRDLLSAYERAFSTDPAAAFGGIIAFNGELGGAVAACIVGRQFAEVIAAPGFTNEALAVLKKKKNLRVLQVTGGEHKGGHGLDYKKVAGGLLVQSVDAALLDEGALQVVTARAPTEQEQRDLLFAWKVAKFVKSNAIVYARGGMTTGIGAGQMSRVMSATIAAMKAAEQGLAVRGAVMASDAFFPFRDGLDAAAEAGISAVIQPGGSVRDGEVIDAANAAGMAMLFTGMRHFRH